MVFEGFGEGTFAFIADLAEHNDRDWFEANRDRYERYWLTPGLDFVEAMGPALDAVTPGVHAEPRVNGSLYRINRDVRFTKDKRPYKTHLDFIFWEGDGGRKRSPGYFVRLVADAVLVAAGRHEFDAATLAAYRAAIDEDATGSGLERIVGALQREGYAVGGLHYKRVPRGFEADHPREELLRHRSLHAYLEVPPPPEVGSADFVGWCVGHFECMKPLEDWVARL
jgi:uncharacterized protein (TIGR02453 family)